MDSFNSAHLSQGPHEMSGIVRTAVCQLDIPITFALITGMPAGVVPSQNLSDPPNTANPMQGVHEICGFKEMRQNCCVVELRKYDLERYNMRNHRLRVWPGRPSPHIDSPLTGGGEGVL